MYGVLLDACVLVPNALCDTLLRLAERGFYRPLWSQRILDETRIALRAVHPSLDPDRLDARIAAMSSAFEDALVTGWEQACAGLDLPDDNDRHVLAAAIVGGAQSLVTFNRKDFPASSLASTSVEVVHPDEFLLDQLDLYPASALQVLEEQAEALRQPPSDLAGVLNRLERCGVPRFADAVRLLLPLRGGLTRSAISSSGQFRSGFVAGRRRQVSTRRKVSRTVRAGLGAGRPRERP